MKQTDIMSLLAELGMDTSNYKLTEKWVSLRCPFARWTHAKGKDKTPSFGVSINPDGMSMFNCFTCHNKGTLPHMIDVFARYTGRDLKHISSRVAGDEIPVSFAPWDVPVGYHNPDMPPPYEPLDPAEFDGLFKTVLDYPEAMEYLQSRKLTRKVIEQFDLRYDEYEKRIIFKVMFEGDLVGLTGRSIKHDHKIRIKNYAGFNPHSFLLGEELMVHPNSSTFPLAVVEGQFDLARFHVCNGTKYADCVGTFGSNLSYHQINRLVGFDRPLVLMLDDDDAGNAGIVDSYAKLSKLVETRVAKFPEDKLQPDELTSQEMAHTILFSASFKYLSHGKKGYTKRQK